MWNKLSLSFFIIHLCINLYAQGDKLPIRLVQRKLNLSVNEGLPSSETYYVHQDKKGFIWICTDRGVARFDGFKMDVFTTKNGLPDNVIFYLVEDDFNRIWFVSNSGKLSYYKNGKIHLYKYNEQVAKAFGVQMRPSKNFHVDKYGNLYFSNIYSSVLKISPNGKIHKLNSTGPIATIHEYDHAYFVLGGETASADIIQIYNSKNQSTIIKSTSKIAPMIANQLRIGTHEFVRLKNDVIELGNNQINRTVFNQITGLFDVDGELVVCTTEGVYFYNASNGFNLLKPAVRHLLRENKVSHVMKDKEGGLWCTTLDNGVYYIPTLSSTNYFVGNGLSENKIYDVFTFQNQVYLTNQSGYYNLTAKKRIYPVSYLYSSLGFEINGKCVIRANRFFDRLYAIDGNKILLSEFESYSKGRDDSYLVSGFKIFRISKNYDFKVLYWYNAFKNKKGNIHADCIAEDTKKGIIYGGNLNGLHYLEGDKFVQNALPSELRNIRISALLFDPKLGLWVGTRGNGIYLLKNNKIIKHIDLENGLIDNQINSFSQGKDDVLWVATNSGVSKVSYYSSSLVRIQNITKYLGLMTSEVNRILEFKDSVYLATKAGLSVFPINFSSHSHVNSKQLTIKRIIVNNKKKHWNGEKLTLDGEADLINLELFSSNYRTTFHKKYRYKLSSEENWIYGSTGTISFINLEPGTYEIQVSYLNEFGNWVKPYKLMSFEKLPLFNESTTFIVLVYLSIFLIIVGAIVYRVRVLRKQIKQLALIEQLEQKSLIAQINPHFIFNSLNSIQSFLVYNENEKAERFLIKFAKLIRSTLSVSRENKISIETEKTLLGQYLELEKMRFKDKFEYQIISNLTTHEEKLIIPPMLIQPFVENSVLHGFVHKEGFGKIQIEFIEIVNNVLSITIIDDGVGRSKAGQKRESEHKSFATDITRERLEAFHKKFNENFYFEIIDLVDENNNATGTKVNLKLPILYA